MPVRKQVRFDINDGDLKNILRRLTGIPQNLQNRVLRQAGKKAMQPVLAATIANTPRQAGKPRGTIDQRHMRDTMKMKIARYTRSKAAAFVFLVGPEAPQVHHAHLVEFGTKPRYTRHTSRYKKIRGRRIVASKPQRQANGKWKRVKKEAYFNTKQSIGSFRDPRKLGIPRYTGVMPAFHPLKRAWDQTRYRAHLILEREIAKGIAKAAKG